MALFAKFMLQTERGDCDNRFRGQADAALENALRSFLSAIVIRIYIKETRVRKLFKTPGDKTNARLFTTTTVPALLLFIHCVTIIMFEATTTSTTNLAQHSLFTTSYYARAHYRLAHHYYHQSIYVFIFDCCNNLAAR